MTFRSLISGLNSRKHKGRWPNEKAYNRLSCESEGGASKTTTAANLGAGLALSGYKVLLIDLDSQCNLTHG